MGEENRCPRCQAIAGVRPEGAGYVCVACGKPRSATPDTTVLHQAGTALPAGFARGTALGLRALGVASVAGGIIAAGLSLAVLPGGWGWGLALLLGGAGVGVGVLSLWAASRARNRAKGVQREARETATLEAARRHGGVLTATTLARELAIGVDEADRTLTAMADGSRVSVEVTDDGFVEYEFRELRRGERPRVRVEASELQGEGGEGVEVEAGSEDERAARHRS
jgi:hypothetical protein